MAKQMQVPTRRFMFLEPPRKVTLAPIYVAVLVLLVLLALGLLGLLAVLWAAPGPTAGPADRAPAETGRSFEGGYLPPPSPPKPPRSGTWM